MNILCVVLILTGMQLSLVGSSDVPYPPAAIAGGVAATVLDLQNGRVRTADSVYGAGPFAAAASETMLGWIFSPSETRKLLALTVFRAPRLFSQGSVKWNIQTTRLPPGLPAPTMLSEPAYPPNASGDGCVILHLEIDRNGAVVEIHILKGQGGLTAPCIEAAQGWQFAPARMPDGRTGASDVMGICVFRAPVVVKPPE